MLLYSYWRSTTSYRVRAALNLKRLPYKAVPVDLVNGRQRDAEYQRLNQGAVVPTLVLDDGTVLTQSLAIIEYLDAMAPVPRLIPEEPLARAVVQAAAQIIALDVHPVNNLRVTERLRMQFDADEGAVQAWMLHWMSEGFAVLEAQVSDQTTFSFGEAPDLADLCLVAQVYNARRWGLDLSYYPKLCRIEAACLMHPAIAAAHPDQQPEARAVQ